MWWPRLSLSTLKGLFHEKKTGGPAFSCSENAAHAIAYAEMLKLPENASTEEKDKVYIGAKGEAMHGMSLRDYFATHAMTGLMGRAWDPLTGSQLISEWADSAYAVADAMLASRSA